MSILSICEWLEASSPAVAISESLWLFPTIETVHVLALTLVIGSIAMLDLRLLGVSTRHRGVMGLADETLAWTWGAFIVAAISGSLMFISAATRYYDNVPFRFKIALLALAGANMAIFHFTAYRAVHAWNMTLPTPVAARVAASLSLLFWIGVVVAGRWVGFVCSSHRCALYGVTYEQAGIQAWYWLAGGVYAGTRRRDLADPGDRCDGGAGMGG